MLGYVQSMTLEAEVLGKSDRGLVEVMGIGEVETWMVVEVMKLMH